jgi:hypothetical protein
LLKNHEVTPLGSVLPQLMYSVQWKKYVLLMQYTVYSFGHSFPTLHAPPDLYLVAH